MKISRQLFPQQALLEQRSAAAKERIQASLAEEGARPLTVGVFQMRNHCDGAAGKDLNLSRMLTAIKAAQAEGVGLLAFPEMCLPGYFTARSGSAEQAKAANAALADVVGQSEYLAALQAAAAAARMVLVFGFGEREGDRVYNAAGVIDADGRWLGTRRKNPLSPGPYDLESFVEPPPDQRSAVFTTAYGTIGVSICFDGEFPESIRRMRLEGAEILVWCNAATGDRKLGHSHRLNAAGCYAQANYMWVACCNCCGEDSYGGSCIYTPWGEPLVQLSFTDEEMGIALINLAMNTEWSTWKDRILL